MKTSDAYTLSLNNSFSVNLSNSLCTWEIIYLHDYSLQHSLCSKMSETTQVTINTHRLNNSGHIHPMEYHVVVFKKRKKEEEEKEWESDPSTLWKVSKMKQGTKHYVQYTDCWTQRAGDHAGHGNGPLRSAVGSRADWCPALCVWIPPCSCWGPISSRLPPVHDWAQSISVGARIPLIGSWLKGSPMARSKLPSSVLWSETPPFFLSFAPRSHTCLTAWRLPCCSCCLSPSP